MKNLARIKTYTIIFSFDQMFKQKAKIITDKLLPAFNTPTGIPYAIVNLKT